MHRRTASVLWVCVVAFVWVTDVRAELGTVDLLNAKVTSLRFFETPYNAPPPNKRQYTQWFGNGVARFIAWELSLAFPAPGRRIDFSIEQRWYRPDGSLLARQALASYVEPNWTSFSTFHSWGWRARAKWPAGSYRVDLIVAKQRIASGTFHVDVPPKEAIIAYNQGTDLMRAGRMEESISLLTRALQIYPRYAEAYSHRCVAHGELGEHHRAIADCNKAIQLRPGFSDAFANRGVAYARHGQVNNAIDDYGRAIELNPNAVNSYSNRGRALFRKEDYPGALKDVNKALHLGAQFDPQFLERLRRANQTSTSPSPQNKPPDRPASPSEPEELSLLIERIRQNYQRAGPEFAFPESAQHDGYIRRNYSITREEGSTLSARYSQCLIPAPPWRIFEYERIPPDYRMSRDSLDDCDRHKHGLKWEALEVRLSLIRIEPSSIKVPTDFSLTFADDDDPYAIRFIRCKDRNICEQLATDLRRVVGIVRKSAAASGG